MQRPNELDWVLQNEHDIAACREAIKGGSKTFFAASLLLPNDVRGAAYAVYAFCRYSDDAIDLAGGDRCALRNLEHRLARVYAGDPYPDPADRAFAATVERHSIPKALPDALLEGFAWDVAGRRYETPAALDLYAARVAGAVGAIMSMLMGARAPDAIARATDLGVAMQLTNIARDIGEDARAGRLYLPLQWFDEAGIDADGWLAAPQWSPEIAEMTRRLLDRADRLYQRGTAGIGFLPRPCRPAILAARLIYAEIGRSIEATGHDSVSARAFVPVARKLQLLGAALLGSPVDDALAAAPPLPANAFLVEAVASGPPPRIDEGASKTLDDKIADVIDLIARLERRDRH